jgi:hypothetical protein
MQFRVLYSPTTKFCLTHSLHNNLRSTEPFRIPKFAYVIFGLGAIIRIAMLFHPLWLCLMVPFAFLKLGPWSFINSILVFQTLLDLLNIWLVIRLVLQQTDAVEVRIRNAAVTLAVAAYALNASSIVRGINGLETTFASLVLLVWLSLYCSLYRDGLSARIFRLQGLSQRHALLWFGLVSGLLFLVRTDFAIIELVSIAVLLLLHRRELRIVWRALVGSLMLATLVALPWLIWNWVTFGSIVQVSANAVPFFAMKKLDAIYPHAGKLLYLIREAARNILKPFFFTAFGASLVVLIYPMLQKKRQQFIARFSGSGLLPPLFGALLLLAYHSLVRGFIRDWYVLQLLPIVSVVFGAAIAYWLDGSQRVARYRIGLIVLTACGLAALAVQEIKNPRYASQPVMLGVAESLGRIREATTIGAFNSGYFSFFASSPVRIEDLDGVVNPAIFPYLLRGTIHQYLDSTKIDHIIDDRGTIEGYQGLLDPDLTMNFPIRQMIGFGTADSLELLSRGKALVW